MKTSSHDGDDEDMSDVTDLITLSPLSLPAGAFIYLLDLIEYYGTFTCTMADLNLTEPVLKKGGFKYSI